MPADMTAIATSMPAVRRTPMLLRVTAFSIFFFPSNMVLAPLGAVGTIPLILSCTLLTLWIASWLWGLHDPIPARNPGRLAVAVILLASFASYAALYLGLTGGSSVAARAAADRWLILLLASAGIVLVAAETIKTLDDVLLYVRALLAGATFCCIVAVIQFFAHVDPMTWIGQAMPGFIDNGGNLAFQGRGALTRVAGSTFHSIELGVVSSMLLPLSVWRALFDPKGWRWLHWVQTGLLVFAVAASISRSGVLGITVAMLVFLPFLPSLARRWALVVLPVVVAALFVGVPGLVSTLGSALFPSPNDPSIDTRVNNYPRVAAMMDERPLLGAGPGNYLPTNALYILDNEYLNAIVTLGLIGLAAMIFYLIVPGLAAIHLARSGTSPVMRCLGGALAAGLLAGGICSATFDSLSFPVFALTYPSLLGLFGAVWIMSGRQHDHHLAPRTIVADLRRRAIPTTAKRGTSWTH
jgi:O-antigen ligase